MSNTSKITISSLVLLVAGCASPPPPTSTVKVPDKLKPGANESLAMIVPAKGVQIYECRARKDQAAVIRMGVRGSRSRSLRRARKQDRPTLCRPALGIDRWQQDLGYGEGTCRRASGRRHSLAAASAKSVGSARLVQQGHEHTAREYRGRRGAQGRLFSSRGRNTGAHQLHGGLLLLHCEVSWPGAPLATSRRLKNGCNSQPQAVAHAGLTAPLHRNNLSCIFLRQSARQNPRSPALSASESIRATSRAWRVRHSFSDRSIHWKRPARKPDLAPRAALSEPRIVSSTDIWYSFPRSYYAAQCQSKDWSIDFPIALSDFDHPVL